MSFLYSPDLPSSSRPPDALRLFPQTSSFTCSHLPYQPLTTYTGPDPLFFFQFILVAVLPRALLFSSCPALWYFCGNLNLPACLSACLRACYLHLPAYVTIIENTCLNCTSPASVICIWVQSCFSLSLDRIIFYKLII